MKAHQPYVIRPAIADDAGTCLLLRKIGWRDAYEFPKGGVTAEVLANKLAKLPPTQEDLAFFVHNSAKKENKGKVLVAETDDSRVVGVIFYEHLANGNGDIGVFVNRSYRNQGIGSALLRELINRTTNTLEVTIFARNPSRGLYKKYRFQEEGPESRHKFSDIGYLPVQKMLLKRYESF